MQLSPLIFLLLLLWGCQSGPTHYTGVKNHIAYHVRIDESLTKKQQRQIEQIIDETFDHINKTYNRWNPYSELSKANCGNIHDLSPSLEHLLWLSDRIYQLSCHRFDPTLASIISQMKKEAKIGVADQGWNHMLLDNACYGWERIKVENHQLVKGANIAIDLDAIAKGQGVDDLSDALKEAGFSNFYIEWGGEIGVSGIPKRIAIANPNGGQPLEVITLSSGGIATSGDGSQIWSSGQTTYSHFVDARSGKPRALTSIAAVTVVAPTCALADGLATSAMLFDDEETLKSWAQSIEKEIPGTAFWIVTRSQ